MAARENWQWKESSEEGEHQSLWSYSSIPPPSTTTSNSPSISNPILLFLVILPIWRLFGKEEMKGLISMGMISYDSMFLRIFLRAEMPWEDVRDYQQICVLHKTWVCSHHIYHWLWIWIAAAVTLNKRGRKNVFKKVTQPPTFLHLVHIHSLACLDLNFKAFDTQINSCILANPSMRWVLFSWLFPLHVGLRQVLKSHSNVAYVHLLCNFVNTY